MYLVKTKQTKYIKKCMVKASDFLDFTFPAVVEVLVSRPISIRCLGIFRETSEN